MKTTILVLAAIAASSPLLIKRGINDFEYTPESLSSAEAFELHLPAAFMSENSKSQDSKKSATELFPQFNSTSDGIKKPASRLANKAPNNLGDSSQDINACIQQGASSEFIYRCGNQLYQKGQVFRWVSYNVPGLLMIEDRKIGKLYGFNTCRLPISQPSFDPKGYAYGTEDGEACIAAKGSDTVPTSDSGEWIPPTIQEQERALLAIQGTAGRVARSYTLAVGPKYHIQKLGQYYEPAWIAFDNALALARKNDIKLIIPLFNHNFDNNAYGSFSKFADLRGKKPQEFWTDPQLRQDVKQVLDYMLNRKNTVNGILYAIYRKLTNCDRYKEDSTILAWELGNELGGWEGPYPAADWSRDIASFLKSRAPNTLVMDGTLGAPNEDKKYPSEVLSAPEIDMYSGHYYNGWSDLQQIKKDSKFISEKYGKVFLIGELGFDTKSIEAVLTQTLNDTNVAGSLVWSLRYHSQDGGFYTHHEKDSIYSYHVPGFQASALPDKAQMTQNLDKIKVNDYAGDSNMAYILREKALAIQGKPINKPFPIPQPASPASGIVYSPKDIRFMGSAWADNYLIFRADESGNQIVLNNGTGIDDHVLFGKTVYSDDTAVKGVKYTYQIIPVSLDGYQNHENPLTIGPLSY